MAALLCLGLIVSGVARGNAEVGIELDSSGPYRLRSSAGPLELSTGQEARLGYRASWLVQGPELTTLDPDQPLLFPADTPRRPRSAVEVSCRTRLPCRATTTAQLPPDVTVEVLASSGPVLVASFDGVALVTTTGNHEVVLGPVDGTIRAVTDRGDVSGHGLAASHVEVATAAGAVHLDFRERPRSVEVDAGDQPVVIVLPAGRYAVTVEGDRSAIIEVEQDEAADSRISIEATGPARVTTAAALLERP